MEPHSLNSSTPHSPTATGNPSTTRTLKRWQWATAGSLFTGYAAYYICRSNLSVATPLLLAEYADRGLTKEGMGLIASAGVATYALGKVVNGLLADRFGGRGLFLGGLFASVACTVAFALSGSSWALAGIGLFVTIWAANRLFQSSGWVALVNIASRWFPVSKHATVMAFLSCSFLLGDALSRAYLGGLIWIGETQPGFAFFNDWRAVFWVAAGTALLIGLALTRVLKADPSHVGAVEPRANTGNLYGEDGQQASRVPLKEILGPLGRSPLFWTVCLTNFGLTLIRETFNFWTPTFLIEEAHLSRGQAAAASACFPLVGAISALLAGLLSDRLKGRHGRVMVPSICGLIGALALLGTVDLSGRPIAAVLLLCLVSFFLLGPYSYLSGVMALDIGGKQASGTVSGISDAAGYFGAILSGYTIGVLAQRFGWSTAFLALAAVAVLALAAAFAYWRLNERQLNLAAAAAPNNPPEHTP